jgi:hypothetical protein
MSRTEGAAREGLRRVGVILARLGLTLHPDKTRVVDVRDGQQGFDFLGFRHQKVESWRWRGKRYLQYWPSRRASQRVRARINAITAPRARLREAVRSIVEELNLVLRGWGAYFRVGNAGQTFRQLDQYVRERLSLFLQKKAGRSGRLWKVQCRLESYATTHRIVYRAAAPDASDAPSGHGGRRPYGPRAHPTGSPRGLEPGETAVERRTWALRGPLEGATPCPEPQGQPPVRPDRARLSNDATSCHSGPLQSPRYGKITIVRPNIFKTALDFSPRPW